MSLTINYLGTPKCQNCCSKNITAAYQGTSMGVGETNVNIIKYKTHSSACFSTFNLTNFYTGTSPNTNPNGFVTSPNVPSAATIPSSELNKGAVFLATSFQIYNLDNGITIQYIQDPLAISISQPGLLPLLPNVIASDTPMITLNGSYAFGSFDLVLATIFNLVGQYGGGFQSLTNPNELSILGSPNIVQIVWPEQFDWELTFISNQNIQYTYQSNTMGEFGITLGATTTTVDLSNPTTTSITSSMCNTAWSVPCNPTGYVSSRQTFNFYDGGISGPSGCSGILNGTFCVDSVSVNNIPIPYTKSCYCGTFIDDIGGTGPSGNIYNLVTVLNNLFTNTGNLQFWSAIPDIEYGYIRFVHPDNILTFAISVNKYYTGPSGMCVRNMTFKQGAITTFTELNSSLFPVTTANNQCIMDGLCWVIESDKNGYFLLS